MLFQTPAFLVLLVVTLAAYWAFPKGRLALLVVADLVFYGLPNPAHLPLFAAAVVITYLCGRGAGTRWGRLLFWTGLAANAANLLFFKYALFFTRSVESLAGYSLPALDSFLVRVVLPVGISFYTFQMIGYLIDVYRDRTAPSRSLAEFWVFVSLFPKVVAGPIARGGQLLPQLQAIGAVRFSRDLASRGAVLLVVGLAKKLVIADTLAPAVAGLFGQGGALTAPAAWVAAYLYTFQLYFDFSAYSDMAVGVGALLGLELPQNFRSPYVAAGPGEFWRRWHITLSQWIRDYVYIPLGGSRAGLPRQLGNLLVAMAFSGLWHGAGWTFVLWGVYHGLLCVGEKLWQVLRERFRPTGPRPAATRPAATGAPAATRPAATGAPAATVRPASTLWRALARAAGVAVTFHLVVLGWVIFRAPDLGTAAAMVRAMLTPSGFSPSAISALGSGWLLAVPALYLLCLAEYLARRDGGVLAFWRTRVPAPLRGLAYALVIALILVFVGTETSSFIYQRF